MVWYFEDSDDYVALIRLWRVTLKMDVFKKICYFKEVIFLTSVAFISSYKLAANDLEISAADQLFYGYGTFFTNCSTTSIMMKYNPIMGFKFMFSYFQFAKVYKQFEF